MRIRVSLLCIFVWAGGVWACGGCDCAQLDVAGEVAGDSGDDDSGCPTPPCWNDDLDEGRHCFGPAEGCEDWEVADRGSGLVETPEGFLTLDRDVDSIHVVWPPSTGTGGVFRVDSRTLEVTGEFRTAPGLGDQAGSDRPAASAVDAFANLLVASRGGGPVWSAVTKIAADPTSCPDVDGDGVVETSRGMGDVHDFPSDEEWGDECILWHTTLGVSTSAAAWAIVLKRDPGLDGAVVESAWVGLHTESRFIELDVETGVPTGVEARIGGPGVYSAGVHDAAIDRDGWVWVVGYYAWGMFDTNDPADSYRQAPAPGGALEHWKPSRVIVDENDAVWTSGMNGGVWRLAADRETWSHPAGLDDSYGIATDGAGSIWVGPAINQLSVYRVDNDDALAYHRVDSPNVAGYEVAADLDGHVWVFGWPNGDGGLWGTNSVAVIDVDTEEAQVVLDDCAGGDCLRSPSPTGYIAGLQERDEIGPLGRWSAIVEGCAEGETAWELMSVDGTAPPGASIAASVRAADTLDDLGARGWTVLGSLPEAGPDFDLVPVLGTDAGSVLEVRTVLSTEDPAIAPVLRGVTIEWSCPDVVE